LPGQRLSARDFDRQVAEVQVRVAVLNGSTALGTPITEIAG
ncbi:MAG: IS5/IS1182 family transposase, partial [Rhodobacter sp.]|nr:IS5/IS1182 family transposase [Rhodobacter sp.]